MGAPLDCHLRLSVRKAVPDLPPSRWHRAWFILPRHAPPPRGSRFVNSLKCVDTVIYTDLHAILLIGMQFFRTDIYSVDKDKPTIYTHTEHFDLWV